VHSVAAKLVVLDEHGQACPGLPASTEVISQLTAVTWKQSCHPVRGIVPRWACLTAVRGGVPQAHVLDGSSSTLYCSDLHRFRHRNDGD